jgi:uncharacterized protein YbaA (DUF1428 family)
MKVDAYILPVPEDKKDEYVQISRVFAEVAKDYGALEIFENWELDVPDGTLTDYRKAVRAEPGEKIVLSWVIWPDREAAEKAHKGMMNDPRMQGIGDMPFDGKRMVIGGFEPILSYRKG